MLVTFAEKLINNYFATVPRSKPHRKQADKTLLIAHRGAHNNAQGVFENTHAAFQLAQEAGCWGIEFDVHATADNVVVVNHDPTLTRLWGHDVAIADLSFNELRALEPGIPSLAEVVNQYSGAMHLFIELKVPFQNEEVLQTTLQSISPIKDYHLFALSPSIFRTLKQVPKEALILVSGHNNNREYCQLSIKEQYGGVVGSYLLLTDKQIGLLKKANQAYGVGFVDSQFSLYRELNRGIVWIFTNQALKISQYLEHLKNESVE